MDPCKEVTIIVFDAMRSTRIYVRFSRLIHAQATWGLLGAVYDGYGRLHPRRKYPKKRAPSLPQKSASVANAVSLHKIAPKGHAREIGNDARPNVRGGGSRDIEAGNHSWRATKISGVAVNVRENLPRDLAPASSAGKLIPNDYKGKVQKVTASRQTRLQGKSDKNTRVEVPNSAALAKSSPSANGSALGLRACEKNPLSPEEQSCPEQSTMVMQCGTERACPRVIREDSPEQEEEKCFKGWQQKPAENGKKRDSLRIVEDKVLVAEIKTGIISLPPDCQKPPGGYQRSYHNSVSHREESSPTTDVLEGKTLTSEKTSHRPRWDPSRQDKGRVTSPETYNREETNAASAGQAYRSVVRDSTSLTTQSRNGHDIVLEEDCQIAPWPPPPPPTSHTLRSVTNMARTKNAIIAPTTVPPAEKEPDGDPGQIDSGIGKASRNQVRCSGRREEWSQVAPGAITKESTTCRTTSPDDVLPIIPSVSAGLEGTELFLSIGGLPPSELSASLTMPQNPFLRSPGFDLLPL